MYKRTVNGLTPKANRVLVMLESILTAGIISVPFMTILYESEIGLTHEQIARYMGSAREVVSRLVKYFAQEKLVKPGRGHLTILDLQGLAAVAHNTRQLSVGGKGTIDG